ncbi:MAG TPA: polysaccharide deacetylase family protein [Candidatus Limnocylindrales bacterium]|nr:polysaccharide deacetylase family protein [Candidatus Limnocylindrales bacterium]
MFAQPGDERRRAHPESRRPRRARRIATAVLLTLLAGIGAAGPLLASTTVVHHGPRSERIVALTFDDGYHPQAVRAILAALDDAGIRATFFPTSSAVKASPAVWRAVAAAGHAIGNHTINHPDLARLDQDAIRHQLTASRTVIERVTGVSQIPYARPPYGSWDAAVVRAAGAAGYRRLVLWDVDSRDWRRPSLRTLVANATSGRPGSIVLLHTLPGTAQALPSIIRSYASRGYRFVTVPQLLR